MPEHGCHPKVGQLEDVMLIQQQIFWLNIPKIKELTILSRVLHPKLLVLDLNPA
jgi:hypothetical protein